MPSIIFISNQFVFLSPGSLAQKTSPSVPHPELSRRSHLHQAPGRTSPFCKCCTSPLSQLALLVFSTSLLSPPIATHFDVPALAAAKPFSAVQEGPGLRSEANCK